jgi:hypothetical protein
MHGANPLAPLWFVNLAQPQAGHEMGVTGGHLPGLFDVR